MARMKYTRRKPRMEPRGGVPREVVPRQQTGAGSSRRRVHREQPKQQQQQQQNGGDPKVGEVRGQLRALKNVLASNNLQIHEWESLKDEMVNIVDRLRVFVEERAEVDGHVALFEGDMDYHDKDFFTIFKREMEVMKGEWVKEVDTLNKFFQVAVQKQEQVETIIESALSNIEGLVRRCEEVQEAQEEEKVPSDADEKLDTDQEAARPVEEEEPTFSRLGGPNFELPSPTPNERGVGPTVLVLLSDEED